MNGLTKISEEEKKEMLEDAGNFERRRAFNSARIGSERGSLDDYIEFLSENMPLFESIPTRRIAKDFRL